MFVYENNVDGARSIDLGGADTTQAGAYIIGYWVGVSTTEIASGYSVDMNGTDPNGNPSTSTAGTGDGNASGQLQGTFFTQHAGPGNPFTFDIGYFSPFGTLRLSYKVSLWAFPS